MKKRKYTGTAYIGVVGPDMDYGSARDSIERIIRVPSDAPPRYVRATKGYEARQLHFNNFIDETKHDFMLLLDSDMVFPRDTLQQLKSHQLPYVTGAYMRRQFQPVMAPVWFKYTGKQVWPRMPATEVPQQGLIRVDASGWGCILIHREVVLEVRKLLKGEPDVIEDDMDIEPYDLEKVMGSINGLRALVNEKPTMRIVRPALEKFAGILADEIKPLRGSKDPVGSDIRYPYFAKQAGYVLWLDSQVAPGHVLHYPLKPDDYVGAGPDYEKEVSKVNKAKVNKARREWRKRIDDLEGATL